MDKRTYFYHMKIIITAFWGFFLPILAKSQSYTIPTNPTLTYLFKTKNEISAISNTKKNTLIPIKVGVENARFNLIKNKGGLYALVDGTGQVYKATSLDQGQITFTRIDSTYFSGNNFNAINYSYNDIIYSFGGYGFWNKNGQLSHLTPGAEWSIDKINRKFKTDNTLYNYLPNKSKLYYIEFPWVDESINYEVKETTVIEFDILKKENNILGKLNDKLKIQYSYLNINVPSINATLIGSANEIILLNFSLNKVYKLTNSKIKDALIGKAGSEPQNTFEDNGKVYYSFNNDTTLRSIQISMDDFKEESYPIYISENQSNYIWFVIIGVCIISLATIIFIYVKRKKNQNVLANYKEVTYIVDLKSNEFNTIENSLISNLIEKSNIDAHLTVDELNTILGIKKKSIEIQKRVRTEAINRINHKFNVNFNLETTFIERTRSDEDRRYFNYIISKENSRIYLNK